jgi:hypothetical protein
MSIDNIRNIFYIKLVTVVRKRWYERWELLLSIVTSSTGNAHSSAAPEFIPRFNWSLCWSICSSCVVFYRLLFVIWSFFHLSIISSVLRLTASATNLLSPTFIIRNTLDWGCLGDRVVKGKTISWRSVLLMEGTGEPAEINRPAENHWQTLSHIVVLIVFYWIYTFSSKKSFNATFSNISAISWRPVLVVKEAGVPGENHRPWASNW